MRIVAAHDIKQKFQLSFSVMDCSVLFEALYSLEAVYVTTSQESP